MLKFACLIIGAFFIGAIPTGYVIARFYGVDIRGSGSGNIGATNVNRVVGRVPGILTLVGDMIKGIIAVLIGSILSSVGFDLRIPISPADVRAMCGAAAVAGHCFSPFLAFRGGKGVATGFGVFLVVAPIPAFLSFLVFVIVVAVGRIVSLGSLASVASFLIMMYTEIPHAYSERTFHAALAAAAIITVRHSGNIQRLLTGDESKVRT